MATWKEWAEEAIEAGYPRGNRWEANRLEYLRENQPELVAELEAKGELLAHVQTAVWGAMQLQLRLEKEGTPMRTAEELALAHLFPERS